MINVLNTVHGARLLSWHFANGWVFEPAIEMGTASTATFCGIFSFICMLSNNYGPSLPAWDDQITLK